MPSFTQPAQLDTTRFILRTLTPQDYAALYAAASDPLIWAQHPSQRHVEAIFQDWFALAVAHGHALVILDRSSGQMIGTTRYYDVNIEARSVAIGYTFLTRPYWQTGANAEIKDAMLQYAFGTVDQVWLHIAPNNARSRRAAEKIGAVYRHDGAIADSDLEHCFYVIEKAAPLP